MASDAMIGTIFMFASNFAPRGYAFCAGQLLSIAQNTALFSILGTYYGGDGRVTFALPDLRGRSPLSAGQGPGLSNISLGEQSGSTSATLTVNEIPAHNHMVNCDPAGSSSLSPAGALPGLADDRNAAVNIYSAGPPKGQMNPLMIQNAGGNQPFS